MSERIIMGIDPGTIVMGYGLIEVRGQDASRWTGQVEAGVSQLDALPGGSQGHRTGQQAAQARDAELTILHGSGFVPA